MNPIEKEIHTLWERAGKISGGRNGQEGKGGAAFKTGEGIVYDIRKT